MSLDRLMFFFGAGVSFPSGLPGAAELTNRLCRGSWFRHTDDRYYKGPASTGWEGIDYAAAAQSVVRNLLQRENRYRAGRGDSTANYEDVFSLLDRLLAEATGQRCSLDTGRLLIDVRSRWKDMIASFPDSPWANDRLASLLQHALDLIRGVIRCELNTPATVHGFDLIAECRTSKVAERFEFVTLNHDLLLERVLRSVELRVENGFTVQRGDVAFYQEESLRLTSDSRLLKPHGSIDWYRLRDNGKDDEVLFEGIAVAPGNPWHYRTPGGWVYSPLNAEPEVVTGTHAKEAAYSDGIFRSQMLLFEDALAKTERVICSGYSWRDSGINVRFRNWLKSNAATRLIVLHKNVAELESTVGWSWFYSYEDFISKGRVVIIPKWLCETTLADITPHLN